MKTDDDSGCAETETRAGGPVNIEGRGAAGFANQLDVVPVLTWKVYTAAELDCLPIDTVIVDKVGIPRTLRMADSHISAGWTHAGRSPLKSAELADGRPLMVIWLGRGVRMRGQAEEDIAEVVSAVVNRPIYTVEQARGLPAGALIEHGGKVLRNRDFLDLWQEIDGNRYDYPIDEIVPAILVWVPPSSLEPLRRCSYID